MEDGTFLSVELLLLQKSYICFVFCSTYSCDQILSHMKSLLSPQRNRLTPVYSENCVKLKVTKYVTDIEQLPKTMKDQSSH